MVKKRIYIAGPMRGFKYYNFEAFDKAKKELEQQGYCVINPADIDRLFGFDAYRLPEDYDWNCIPNELRSIEEIIQRDIQAIFSVDTVYMLDGWEKSTGSLAEYSLAKWLGKEIIFQTPININEQDLINHFTKEDSDEE